MNKEEGGGGGRRGRRGGLEDIGEKGLRTQPQQQVLWITPFPSSPPNPTPVSNHRCSRPPAVDSNPLCPQLQKITQICSTDPPPNSSCFSPNSKKLSLGNLQPIQTEKQIGKLQICSLPSLLKSRPQSHPQLRSRHLLWAFLPL